MHPKARVDKILEDVISRAASVRCPPLLAKSVRHAVFPGGARARPLLCMAVAEACGTAIDDVVDAAAGAIELLHCASLVHDDLPCFDDAYMRRGKPSVHCAFGEPLAVLTGDALIILAFEMLATRLADRPAAMSQLLGIMSQTVGMSGGLVAGQAWESEERPSLEEYHLAKTASLFIAAVTAGAASSGAPTAPWVEFGAGLGKAYQVADDIRDRTAMAATLGKPVGRDAVLRRPNATAEIGVRGAIEQMEAALQCAVASIPACPGRAKLVSFISSQLSWCVTRDNRQQAPAQRFAFDGAGDHAVGETRVNA